MLNTAKVALYIKADQFLMGLFFYCLKNRDGDKRLKPVHVKQNLCRGTRPHGPFRHPSQGEKKTTETLPRGSSRALKTEYSNIKKIPQV